MKLYASVASLLLFSLFGHAQGLLSETKVFNNVFEEKVVPTTDIKTRTVAAWTINDSLRYIPAYDTYCGWNTARVHPYHHDLTNLKDSIRITLVHTGDTCGYSNPFAGSYLTSDFGSRRYRYHYGVDIKVQVGDPIQAAFDGVVRVAHYDADYGRVVVIRHNNGLETLYAHMSKLKVKPGDWVDAGDVIGLGGNTGRSTGSHLHFECRYLGEPINPWDIINWETGELQTEVLYLSKDNYAYLKELRSKKFMTIRRGDTLSGIARRYGTSVSRLCRLNSISASTTLRVGQVLRYH